MKKLPLLYQVRNTILGLLIAPLAISCGSFQGSSYYASDGIYVSQSRTRDNTEAITKSNYYEQYFKNAADEGYVEPSSNDIYFTDTDTYSNPGEYQDTVVENGNSQIPWGEQTSQTEIILINNRPFNQWGLSSFAFGYSPFWNNYYANPYRFGYGSFYSPFNNYPYWNPYRGYAGFWGGFDPFFPPFYGGFYGPYGFGYGFGLGGGFRNHWANRYPRWNRYGDYNRNGYNRRNDRVFNTTVARINSGRGEKNYQSSNPRKREKSQDTDVKTRNVQNTLNRFNVGRGVASLGRTTVIGYDRNRLENNPRTHNSSRVLRPNGTTVNPSRGSLTRLGNTNITKTPQVRNTSTGRVQSQYRLVERNPNRTSATVQRRSASQVVRSPRTAGNSRAATRVVRQPNRNQNKSVRASNNNQTQRSNNYSRSNNSYSNNRSSGRSYNSGNSSRSSFSSGRSSSSSAGRGSSSSAGSSGGRRN